MAWDSATSDRRTLQHTTHTATHTATHAATHTATLHHTATDLLQMARVDTLSLAVKMVTAVPHERRTMNTHCNTLQHTVKHSNTLHHTATLT